MVIEPSAGYRNGDETQTKDLPMTPPYCIQEIETALTPLPLPNPKFLAAFLVGLLTCQKARFAKIAQSMPGEAKAESQEMRLRRYLDHPHLSWAAFAQTIAALLPKRAPWVLALDRTNWERGDRDVNLLSLAVVVGNTAVPVLWCDLARPGNSDTKERIALVKEFLTLFGKQSIHLITADREFIGADWLAWLQGQNLPFLIRIRKDDLLTRADGTYQEAFRFFTLRAAACRNKKQPWDLWGTSVFVGGKRLKSKKSKQGRNKNEDWLIVVSNRPTANLLALYRLRWGIETLFQAMKGRGFDLEGCSTPRIARFLGLLALGYVWSLRAGMYLDGIDPCRPLKHGRLPVSWFRRGLDYLHRLLAPLAGRPDQAGFDRAMLLLRQVPLPAKVCL
jgi:hypothetical protein